jgi:ABC-type cobalamin/Fe3+-siderophores transport system ATPase subunit
MVTHDLGMVVHHADHVICLNRTVIAEGVPGRVLDGPTLLRLFGMHMGLMDAARLPACEHCRGGEPAAGTRPVPSGEQPRPPAGAGHGRT